MKKALISLEEDPVSMSRFADPLDDILPTQMKEPVTGQGARDESKFAVEVGDVDIRASRSWLKEFRQEAAAAGFVRRTYGKMGRPPLGRDHQITLKVRPQFAALLAQLRDETKEPYSVMVEKAICEFFEYDYSTLDKGTRR